MYSLEDIYLQAFKDEAALIKPLDYGISIVNNGVKLKKLKATRESLLIKYSKKNKQLNKLTNGKQF